MPAIIDKDLCTGCVACVDSCPVEAISMNGKDLAVVDSDACVDCGDCVDTCPVDAISMS